MATFATSWSLTGLQQGSRFPTSKPTSSSTTVLSCTQTWSASNREESAIKRGIEVEMEIGVVKSVDGVDYVGWTFRPAEVAAEGANILALRSTTGSGESRIVTKLGSAEVSVPSYLIDYVVTEWGVADLRTVTRRECAERITGIAHPDHRESLEQGFRRIMQKEERH
jgi:Acetyl-CoA hydrolase/transferase C-terminal domain